MDENRHQQDTTMVTARPACNRDKAAHSSKQGAKASGSLGLHRKFVILRRGSPRKHSASSHRAHTDHKDRESSK